MNTKYFSIFTLSLGLAAHLLADPKSEPRRQRAHTKDEIHLKSVEATLNELNSQASVQKSISTFLDKSHSCEFSSLCSRLAENSHSTSFYKNSDGESLPNYPLKMLKKTLQYCKANLKDKIENSKNPKKNEAMSFEEQAKAASEKMKAKTKKFYDLLETNQEEAAYVKISKAMLDLPPRENEAGYGMYSDPKNIRKDIEEAQVKSGQHLKPETVEAWVASLIMDQETLGSQPHMNFPEIDSNDGPFDEQSLLTTVAVAGTKEKVLAFQKQFQDSLDKTYNLFKETQDRIVKVLESRMNAANGAEIKSMIERIRSVKMNVPPVGASFSGFGPCGAGPNAFYAPFDHSFTVCPEFLQMPAASIQTVIAHELGHAIDPCTASFTLNEVSGEKHNINGFSGGGFFGAGPLEGYIPFTPKIPAQRENHLCSMNEGMAQDYYRGLFKDPELVSKASDVGLTRNPFASVIKCLESEESVRARMGDVDAIKRQFAEKIQAMEKDGVKPNSPEMIDLKKRFSALDKNWVEHSACGFVPAKNHKGTSQMQEAFADWVSGQVMAQKIKESPDNKKKNQLAFETVASFAVMNGCENFQGEFSAQVLKLTKEAGCTPEQSDFAKDLADMSAHHDVHPEDEDRVTRIFMANPEIQMSLGCGQKAGVKNCE